MNAHQRRKLKRAEQRQAPALILASYGRPVSLQAIAESSEADGPIWIECCLSGTYLGHPAADKLEWGPQLFDLLIANLHANPSFKAGPDGVGCVPVIPWDYEHASEIAKANNAIPADGCPSCAWTLDFQVRPGADGKPSFWALTDFLPVARAQVRTKQYRWCSLAVAPSYINPVTGLDQGQTVTSIALTNDPFIQGLVPLAASRNSVVTQTLDQWGKAQSDLEALIGLKRIFKLPDDSTPDAVIAQLKQLRLMVESNIEPGWLDLERLLGNLRELLGFPLLATPDEILGGAEAVTSRALTGQATADPSASVGDQTMSANSLNTALASRFKCNEDDASILLAAAKQEDKIKCSEEAADAFSRLKQMLGGDDMSSVIANCTKMLADAKQLGPVLEALNAAQTALKGNAENDAANEAAVVAASIARGDADLEKRIHPVILAARRSCFDEKTGIVDEAKLAKFRADYPVAEEQRALLTRRVVAGPNGSQLGGPITAFNTQPITQSAGGFAPPSNSNDAQVKAIVDAINSSEGSNAYAKANTLLCARLPGHKNLPWSEQCRRAGEFTREVMAGKIPSGFTLQG